MATQTPSIPQRARKFPVAVETNPETKSTYIFLSNKHDTKRPVRGAGASIVAITEEFRPTVNGNYHIFVDYLQDGALFGIELRGMPVV